MYVNVGYNMFTTYLFIMYLIVVLRLTQLYNIYSQWYRPNIDEI